MKKLYETQELVEDILRRIPATRGSDRLLYLEVLKRTGIDVDHTSVSQLLLNPSAPKTESVRRSRQKLQHMYKELKPTSDVEAMRELNEERVRRYALGRLD